MNIAIIGTGNVGSGLARVLAATASTVTVTDRDSGADGAAALRARGVDVQSAGLAAAVAASDVVILAVPFGAVAEVAGAADFTGKIVVDVSNPLNADFSALQVGHTTSAAEETAKLLPGARVVKAFNTVFAQHYAEGLNLGDHTLQTFVASDDEAARATVIDVANAAGFDARDAGGLANARYLEPLGYLNIHFGYILGHGTAIAPAWVARKEAA